MNTVKIKSKNVGIIAHRGLSGIERENTNPAFVAACNRSYYGVETDVHVTSDGKFVIIHDETTERVSDQKYNINVEENTFDALSDVVLPDKDGDFYRSDIRIPSLEEYIKICKKYDKICVLDLENVIFISFEKENCVCLRKHLESHDIQWLTGREVGDSEIEFMKKYNLNLDIAYRQLSKPLVKKLHKNGIKVNCWTCDSKEDAENLVKMGVDFITTNILEGDK